MQHPTPTEPVDFQLLFDALPVPYLALDLEFVLVAVNEMMCRAVDQPREALLGRHFHEVFPTNPLSDPDAVLQQWELTLEEVRARLRPVTMPVQRYNLPRTNGRTEVRYWQTTVRPVLGADRALRYLLCRAEDVTARLRMEQEGAFSKESYELLTRATHDTVWDVDLRRGSIWRNELFTERFGYPLGPEQATIEFWRSCVHPDDLAQLEARMNEALTGKDNLLNVEYRLRKADGTWAYVADRAFIVRDAEGAATRLVGAMQDITDQRQAERELEQSAARFRALTEAQQHMVWTTTPEGVLDYINPYWKQYMGVSLAEARNWGWGAHAHPDDLERVRQERERTLRTGELFETELRLRNTTSAGYRWFLARSYPVRDANGLITQWVGTATDIHDRREALALLQKKDQQLQRIIDTMPAYIALMTGPGHVLSFINDNLNKLLGGHGRPGLPVTQVVPDIAQSGLLQILDNLIVTKETFSVLEAPFTILNPDTQEPELHYYDFTYQPLLDEESQSQAVLMFAVEATERVLARREAEHLGAEISRRDERLRRMMEALPNISYINEASGVGHYVSPQWYAYTGLPGTAGIDEQWRLVIHPDDLVRTEEEYARARKEKRGWSFEIRFRRYDGEYRWFLNQTMPELDVRGNIVRWFGTNTDITELRQLQQRLEQQNQELTRTNQDLDNFVYTASHDLKQPINNMAGIFHELVGSAHFSDPDAGKLISMFERALQQIFDTIHNLSDLVQVQKLRQEILAEPIPLAGLTYEVLDSIRDQTAAIGAIIELDVAQVPVLEFVRPNLRSILYNLLSNAVKYAATDRTSRITIQSLWQEDHAVLVVQDNGLGIDLKRYGSQLFQMFRRFHVHVEGSGMGLYLVNRIVQSHGGRLEVHSKVGEGTAFRVHFAAAGAALAAPREPILHSL
ncbi:PAS domain-containing protein [Hymenobacter sp. BT491]|uniref:PAS domain-containing protein n=1 Tax=Hymenobacter sp. BT491 TaxID=2766779 RepID=UPI001653C724|nr:PAS domain-containing protein [Hymenobacter sp. BT491]MBC6991058.1 PAS domain-containing protein [Hymenobacter sp. BT491]